MTPPPSEPPPKATAHAQPKPPSEEPATPRPAPAAAAAATSVDSERDNVPEHELVAPVEMWFGDHRVGVKAGTRTYELFQKYSKVLFDDLKRAMTSTPV
jgi:hypothetical protein